jgi:type I restriction enzyme S subunit
MTKIHGKIGELSRRVKVGFVGTCEKYYTNETRYPMIRTTNLSEGGIDFTDLKYVTEEFYEKNKKSQLHDGDVLIARFGTSGTACVYHGGDAQCLNAIIVEPDLDTTIPEYLAIVINSRNVREQINRKIVGSTQAILNTKVLSDIEIDLPSIEVQHKIVKIFYSIQQSCSLRKREIEILDQLIKARFVEMFGDPIRNTQNRKTTEFVNVVKMQRGFDLPVQERRQEGDIPVYGSNGALDHHNVAKVQGGGVITGRSGTIGKVFYTEGDYWPLNTSLFSVDTHGNNVVYLAYLLEMFDLSRFVEGTGVPTLNRNMFHNKSIIEVELAEQKQFADFVKQVDKSKVAIQKSLEKTQLLFDSLMQKYFG